MRKLLLMLFPMLMPPALMGQGLFESATLQEQAASESSTTLQLGGYTRGVVLGGAENYDFSTAFGELALTARASRGKGILFGDVRFREGSFFGSRESVLQVREAYAGYRGRFADIYLGNQIVSWGRTDGFNPTSNISPSNFFLLTPDPDDQKLGNLMLRTLFRLGSRVTFEAIAIPIYMPSVYRYELFEMGEGVTFEEADRVSPEFRNVTYGGRLNFELPAVGFSFSYFHGYDPFYGFGLKNLNLQTQQITYQPKYYLKDAVGADFELPVGKWIARGEAALNLTTGYQEAMSTPNPDISYVVGIERTIGGVTAIAQYLGKYVIDFNPLHEPVLTNPLDPLALAQYGQDLVNYQSTLFNRKAFQQQEEANHAVFISLSRSFAYDVLSAELSGYYNITSEEYLVRPNLAWKATDDLALSLGASWMWGADGSIFSMAGKVLSGAWLSVKYSF